MTVEINLKNKNAIITGNKGDIGKAIVKKLQEAGAICIGVDTKKNRKTDNNKIIQIEADFQSQNWVENVYETIKKNKIKVDILVNNAGFTIGHDFVEYPLKDWNKTILINLTAPFLLSQKLIKQFNFKGGTIINIISLASFQGFPSNPAYVSSKAGLKQLTQAMAIDLAKYNIRVNAIAPGYVKTKMTSKSWNNPKAKYQRTQRMINANWAKPKDIANSVLFLSSELSSYINGQSIIVDGGWLAKGL